MKKYVIATTEKPPVRYEVEVQRKNISPRQFFTYCAKQFKLKTGADISCWVEDYGEWSDPTYPQPLHNSTHRDDGEVFYESSKYMPYDWQLFYSGAYNFIMEYEFGATNNDGWGYFYAIEYER
jgi:hypothetical protein